MFTIQCSLDSLEQMCQISVLYAYCMFDMFTSGCLLHFATTGYEKYFIEVYFTFKLNLKNIDTFIEVFIALYSYTFIGVYKMFAPLPFCSLLAGCSFLFTEKSLRNQFRRAFRRGEKGAEEQAVRQLLIDSSAIYVHIHASCRIIS